MKSGCHAKLPRDILNRFDEFKHTTVLSFDDTDDLELKVDQIVIPAPKTLPIAKIKGSTAAHPIRKPEIEAISGPYLEFARSWVPESVGTSSRAKVDAMDLAISLSILKFCSRNMNSDGTMPTNRTKIIWDRLLAEGEIQRAFDYHRWRVIRDLIEIKDGLEMEDRHYYSGFVNKAGTLIKGRAAKWKMADWLVEKLDEMVELGYQQDVQESARSEDLDTSLVPVIQSNDNHVSSSSLLLQGGGGALLEQDEYQELEDLFDRDWLIEFVRSEPPMIGLIWAGSIKDKQRETG